MGQTGRFDEALRAAQSAGRQDDQGRKGDAGKLRANPYQIEGPAVIAFSGGRTSALMLYRILEAGEGRLAPDVHVVFSNTGRERPETLDFIRECSARWHVPVRWVEWVYSDNPQARFREVSHETASRNGEPFEAMCRWKRFLPNPVMRTCTQNLKIESMKLFRKHALGIDADYVKVLGIRYDEPRRWKTLGQNPRDSLEWTEAPLVSARVTVEDVHAFWASMPFDLGLRSWEGNCDLCFLKGKGKVLRILRDRPDLAEWWIRMEATPLGSKTTSGPVFRSDRAPYARMLEQVRQQPSFPFAVDAEDDGGIIDCLCSEE